MQSPLRFILIAALLSVVSTLHAADSGLRITCEGRDVGAEVWINGKFRGECPVDLKVPAGALKLLVRKQVDADREQVFQQDIRMGEDSIKKVEIQLPAPRLTAEGQKRVDERQAIEQAQALQRQAAERAEAQRRADERQAIEQAQALQRQAAERAERAEAQRREALAESALAEARAEFDAALASGAIKASFRDCADCPEMVAIAPGSFEMGSSNGDKNEKPVHRVNISRGFAIGKTEVTQAEWKSIMGDNPSHFNGFFNSCGDNCPVEQVSWNDVKVFIQKLNAKTGKQYRLPSEAEWEYACRAGGKHEYCGSDTVDSIAWYSGNSGQKTHPVAGKQANAFGLFDMSGNVWEWVEDSYHDSYAGAPNDGSAWQGNNSLRVLRGGSWDFIPQYTRAADRIRDVPAGRNSLFGFRLARMLP